MPSRLLRLSAIFSLVLIVVVLSMSSAYAVDDEAAAEALPPNLGHGLRQLIVWHRAQPRALAPGERRARLTRSLRGKGSRLQVDPEASKVVADVTLDGKVTLAAVCKSLEQLGIEVFALYDADRAGSVLSVRLPLDLAETTAELPGVYSINTVHRAWRRVGSVTSEGAYVLKTGTLGFDGKGITVGVLSDSYDTLFKSSHTATRAGDDIRKGDLPGIGNPFKHNEEVVVSEALPGDEYQQDEGRAMLQIVHDLAPGAKLVFHRAGETPADLAAGILELRSANFPKAVCDVIVDDFGFPDEPMFSDGPAALAAKTVATDLLLPGHPVTYVSSAGNTGDVAYEANFTPVSVQDSTAVEKGRGNLRLDQVPADLLEGGLHNFNPKPGKVTLNQKVKAYGEIEISFQWDDPFIPEKITSDYNLLVFDAQGNYLPDLSGTDYNLRSGKALEIIDLPTGESESVTYQLAITRRNTGTGIAKRLRYVVNGSDASIKFLGYNHATTFGHNAGPNVIGVAAYAYDNLKHPEYFSSLGPATICFDADGNRLEIPEIRQQPAIAAVDGVNTSFFPPGRLKSSDEGPGTDTDSDGFPNFFGTSAAAPHVAAVAALLLQAAGGPGSLSPDQVLESLQSTALIHDLDPNSVSGAFVDGRGSTVSLTATADEGYATLEDKNVFQLAFQGPEGQFLRKVIIDLRATGLKFDPDADGGSPFKVGTRVGLLKTDITTELGANNTSLTLNFSPGVFTTGRVLSFGLDRDSQFDGQAGNTADLLAGAKVKVKTAGSAGSGNARGVLADKMGLSYGRAAGFGLVDAEAAIKKVLASPPKVPNEDL